MAGGIDGVSIARQAGRALGLDMLSNFENQPSTNFRYATVESVSADSTGKTVACLLVAGGTLTDVPVLLGACPIEPGYRVAVLTANHQSVVLGPVVNSGTSALAFDWSSTWTGEPSGTKYTEATQKVFLSGLILCQIFAGVGGTGEYGMAFDFVQDGSRKAYWCATSPQKNGGTLNFNASGIVKLPPGEYDVTLTSNCWGSVTIGAPDSSADTLSKRFRDQSTDADGVGRYARLVRL